MSPNRQQRRLAEQRAWRATRSPSREAPRRGEPSVVGIVAEPPEGSRPRRGGDPEAERSDEEGPRRAGTDRALRGLESTAREGRELRERQVRLVQEARAAGASWGAIGAALGCSRQAAQQRYGGAR